MNVAVEEQAVVGQEPAERNRLAETIRIVVPPVIVFFFVIGIWYLVTYVVLDEGRRWLLPPPHEVVTEGFLVADTFGEIIDGLWESTKVALIGLTLAFVVGFAILTYVGSELRGPNWNFYWSKSGWPVH